MPQQQTFFKKILARMPKIGQILWFLGERAFWMLMFLILLLGIWGAFIFYQYVYLAKIQTPQVDESSFQFKEEIYRKILIEWETRTQKFEKSLKAEYKSPF